MMSQVPIEQMTIEEKLLTMEALWQDLIHRQEVLPVYDWQKQILDERAQLMEEGKTKFIDWEQAKQDIARETS